MIMVMQTWVHLSLADGAAAFGWLSVSGQALNASLMPIALAGLAAALALTIAGSVFRRVLGLIVLALGLGIAALTFNVISNTQEAVSRSLSEVTGLSGSGQFDLVTEMSTTWLLPATLAAGVALALLGVMVLIVSGSWRSGGRKYSASTPSGGERTKNESIGNVDRFDDWDRQTGGEDPSAEARH